MNDNLLEIKNLKVNFYTYRGIVEAIDNVDLQVKRGETHGIVGETGCGKSVTALSVLGLIDAPGRIVDGEIFFKGENLLSKSDKEMRNIRGREISMIFQEVTASLNPVFTIGSQITDVIMLHQKSSKKEAEKQALRMLELVRISDYKNRFNAYPHELSNGMKQRVMISMALSCHPSLLMADEPTTALDVTTQAQILKLVDSLKEEYQFSVVLITHNLGVVAENCDSVTVMYAGNVVESASTEELFSNPKHPYTTALLECIPHGSVGRREQHLHSIGGRVPNLINPPAGCRFHPRCPIRRSVCNEKKPELRRVRGNHMVWCHF